MSKVQEAVEELERQRGQWGRTSQEERRYALMATQATLYRDALRAIASGELTKGKAVQLATIALEKGKPYQIVLNNEVTAATSMRGSPGTSEPTLRERNG